MIQDRFCCLVDLAYSWVI
ncbi:hypothetical protein QOM74_004691 [Salmonella enterica]|nr:hypothetical protein [Salmonella enterica subsp. enterica serovar Chester]EHX1591566.1 hypothetical protein [Salmonella enterica subsp. enterica serovar Richmond]EII9659444.1 hypothetical protein [Salmonella enterica]EJN6737025.1 hypothetical protein [Salmonella enterica subsp. enterica serovar Anatum]EKI9943938.1 hypothetical protein [Salmonella enterica subsp. enterica serovar Newport]